MRTPDKREVGGSSPPRPTNSLPMTGALAQLGEHLLCKQRVIGSIPIGSTKRCGLQVRGPCAVRSVAQVVRAHA